MKVVLNQNSDSNPDAASRPSATTPATGATTTPATPASPQEITAENQKTAAPPEDLQANITFRQDAAGQVYYVLTDPESGKELREVPPAEIRNVSEGIANYLKQEATKATSRVKVKA